MTLPENFKNYMKNLLGDEYDAFIKSYDDTPIYTGVRVNTLKSNEYIYGLVNDFERVKWCKDGYMTDKSVINGKHPYHIGGAIYFQEPSAMAAVEALPIEEGDFVLDLCAAPGGKSTQAAARLGNTGLLVSNEIVRSRAEILAENIERCGIKNALVTNENPQTLVKHFPEFFDKIIVDAPCSGEGMFRKEPQAVTEWSIEHTRSCAVRQQNILDCAVKMLRPGGMLVYSTCTFSKRENEDNAKYIEERLGLKICDIPNLSMLDNGIDLPGAKRVFPHKSKGEGHFVALFKKEGEKALRELPKGRPSVTREAEKLYRSFEKDTLNIRLGGHMYQFGTKLYILPFYIDIDKLKVLRPGVMLGECKKNRFEPSHALSLALKKEDFKNVIDVRLNSKECEEYLKGGVIPCDKKGYTAVVCDDLVIGWGKASNGVLKNHFPKYMRIR